MLRKTWTLLLIHFSILIACIPLESAFLDHSNLVFETAHPSDREFLVNFAIESNDIYQTRTANIEVAKQVFEISDDIFEKGIVEVLKCKGEVVGFYTLKVHHKEESWFEHELSHLFVKAGLQRRGYGSLLYKRALAVARENGWERLVWISDPDARQFYLKMGATIIEYWDNFLNPEVDLPIFEKIL